MGSKQFRIWASGAMVLVLSACVSTGGRQADLIVGTWETRVGGFPLEVTYGEDTSTVSGYDAIPYTIEEDRLVVGGAGGFVRILSFPARDEMIQTDPLTGTEQRYVRVQ